MMYGGISGGALNAANEAIHNRGNKHSIADTILNDYQKYLGGDDGHKVPIIDSYRTDEGRRHLIKELTGERGSSSIDPLFVSITYSLTENRPTVWSNAARQVRTDPMASSEYETDVSYNGKDCQDDDFYTTNIEPYKFVPKFSLYDAVRASTSSQALGSKPELVEYDGVTHREVDGANVTFDPATVMLYELTDHYAACDFQLNPDDICMFTIGNSIETGSGSYNLRNPYRSLEIPGISIGHSMKSNPQKIYELTKSYLKDEGVQSLLEGLTGDITEAVSYGFEYYLGF